MENTVNNTDEISIARMYHNIRARELEKKHEDINNNNVYLNDSEITMHNTTIIGNNNKIRGKHNVIIGNNNNIKSGSSRVEGAGNDCRGHNYDIYGQNNTLYGNNSKISGNGNKVVGRRNSVIGKHNVEYSCKKEEACAVTVRGGNIICISVEIPKKELESTIKDESVAEEVLCIICSERRINTVILDCRHSKMCVTCSRRIMLGEIEQRKCPVCREEIKKGIIKIF